MRIRRLLGSAFVVLGGLLATSCALTVDKVKLEYQPQTDIQKIENAESVTLKVNVEDSRSRKDRISSKKNGYGMEMAAIVAENDVPGLVKNAIEEELRDRGFKIGGGPVDVNVELERFYCDFKTGFFSGDALAEVVMNVQVKTSGVSIAFARVVSAEGKEANVQLASGTNAKLALDRALKAAMEKLFKDQAFLQVLMPPRTVTGPPPEKGPPG